MLDALQRREFCEKKKETRTIFIGEKMPIIWHSSIFFLVENIPLNVCVSRFTYIHNVVYT